MLIKTIPIPAKYSSPTTAIFQDNIIQLMLFCCMYITIIIWGLFYYLRTLLPELVLLKDVSVFFVLIFTIADIYQRKSSKKLNFVDVSILLFTAYLLVIFLNTYLKINSVLATYLGFRTNYLPILLYFGFRRIDFKEYNNKLFRLIILLLIIGAILTITEFITRITNLAPPNFFIHTDTSLVGPGSNIANWYSLGNIGEVIIPRPLGITGNVSLLGIYHLALLALFFYFTPSKSENSSNNLLGHSLCITLIMFLSLTAIILSTTRLAWFILLVCGVLVIIEQRRISTKAVLVIIAGLSAILLVSAHPATHEAMSIGIYKNYQCQLTNNWMPEVNKLVKEKDCSVIGHGYLIPEMENRGGRIFSLINIPLIGKGNQYLLSDFEILNIFKSFGIIGFLFHVMIFLLIPLKIFFNPQISPLVKGATLGVILMSLSFIHQSPLKLPMISVILWYQYAVMAQLQNKLERE